MPIPIRKIVASPDEAYRVLSTDDGSRTLVETASDDAFHSGCGALAETRHVHLLNSGVRERLLAHEKSRVLEVGLGTGMAMLCTLDLACQHHAPLEYVGLEKNWITADVLNSLEPHSWVGTPSLVDTFLQWRASFPKIVPPGCYEWHVDASHRVRVVVGDAIDYQRDPGDLFDAVYFDPFAPTTAPALWDEGMLRKMHAALVTGGRLVTYCCSRAVRDVLERVGFECRRVPGPPGGKREVLVASRSGQSHARSQGAIGEN